MATLTIRNLDETVKRRLQVRAASHGRSMEAEARAVLAEAMDGRARAAGAEPGEDLGTAMRRLFAPLGGVDLPIPSRHEADRPIPTFDE